MEDLGRLLAHKGEPAKALPYLEQVVAHRRKVMMTSPPPLLYGIHNETFSLSCHDQRHTARLWVQEHIGRAILQLTCGFRFGLVPSGP